MRSCAKGLIATIEPSAVIKYTTADHLGTPRVITGPTGALISRHDYKPFGEEVGAGIGGRTTGIGYSVVDGVRQKFTLKERDIETGLDYFRARYYASTQGRFTSADSFGGSLSNPQSLNLYSYSLNDPVNLTDPTGHFAERSVGGRNSSRNYAELLEARGKNYRITQDPKQPPPATRPGDDYPASANGSPNGKIADVTIFSGYEPVSTTIMDMALKNTGEEAVMGRVLTVAGTASTVADYGMVSPFSGAWRGANGVLYPIGHHPNGATGSLSLVRQNAGAIRGLGRLLGGAGIALSLGQGYQAYERGDRLGVVKSGFDAGFGAAGTFGGPYGAGAATIYFGVDMTVGWPAVSRQANKHPMITGVTPSPFLF